MLVLTRKPGEKVLIGDGINVTVAEVKGNKVYFDVECRQGDKLIGSGMHKRAIVPAAF